MTAKRFTVLVCAFVGLQFLLPEPAIANMGPPILWMGIGVVFVVELIVIVVEWPVLKRLLPVSWLTALGISTLANGASALLGALVGSLGIWFVFKSPQSAADFGLIGLFFVCSTLIETPIVRRFAGRIEWKRALIVSASANAFSHLLMAALLLWLVLRSAGGV